MELFEDILDEIKTESAVIADYLQGWWGGMSTIEQTFCLSFVCAGFLLLGVIEPKRAMKTKTFETEQTISTIKQFMFASVVLFFMTYGLNIAARAAM